MLWQVNGVNDDNLHKVGEGTLTVNGKGVNNGGLKVGDGTVILNQRPDDNGHK
ncbi:immunoglobulin A1 protease family protein, partial [Escherichia coli 6-319-05_S4_C3]